MTETPKRPLLRYHGGKWRLAPWIIAHFPRHHVYLEPFGGAASVLLQKERSYAEIYNDLDEEVVGLFRILRDPAKARTLRRLVERTPYARTEFEQAYLASDDEIERARRLIVRSWMGHGSSGLRGHKTGFRLGSHLERTNPGDDWADWPDALPALVARLRGVMIERRPAAQVIAKHDRPDTLMYLDPPYMFSVRSKKRIGNDLYHGYRHEIDDSGHKALLKQLTGLAAMVVLSGYPHPMYDKALKGWRRFTTDAHADRGEKRVEALWLNPACVAALGHGPLFDGVAA